MPVYQEVIFDEKDAERVIELHAQYSGRVSMDDAETAANEVLALNPEALKAKVVVFLDETCNLMGLVNLLRSPVSRKFLQKMEGDIELYDANDQAILRVLVNIITSMSTSMGLNKKIKIVRPNDPSWQELSKKKGFSGVPDVSPKKSIHRGDNVQ